MAGPRGFTIAWDIKHWEGRGERSNDPEASCARGFTIAWQMARSSIGRGGRPDEQKNDAVIQRILHLHSFPSGLVDLQSLGTASVGKGRQTGRTDKQTNKRAK